MIGNDLNIISTNVISNIAYIAIKIPLSPFGELVFFIANIVSIWPFNKSILPKADAIVLAIYLIAI
jgi:hypothetical protein